MASPQMHLTVPERREQLARLRTALAYMKDDSAVAVVLGLPIETVKAERAKLKPAAEPRLVVAGVHETTYHINDGAVREAAASSCLAHLKALLRSGLKHNSDIGMGRDAFYARCAEHGVHL